MSSALPLASNTANTTWQLIPEFASQEAVLVAWPHAGTDWSPMLEAAEQNFATMIAAFSASVRVWVLIPDQTVIETALQLVAQCRETFDWPANYAIEFSVVQYNDTWTRDYGPLCVFRPSQVVGQWQLRLQDFHFNGWGNKWQATADNSVTQALWQDGEIERVYLAHLDPAQIASVQMQTHEQVLEGGSIESNGQVLLTTKSCLLNSNRNPKLSQTDLESLLTKQFGCEQVVWLTLAPLPGDDTDGHIDTLARFVASDHVVYQGCQDPADPRYEALQQLASQLANAATKFQWQLTELPCPPLLMAASSEPEPAQALPATYANFLLLNNRLFLPTYGCATDTIAIECLAAACPNYIIVPIDCQTLVRNFGSLHCSTMQLPKLPKH